VSFLTGPAESFLRRPSTTPSSPIDLFALSCARRIACSARDLELMSGPFLAFFGPLVGLFLLVLELSCLEFEFSDINFLILSYVKRAVVFTLYSKAMTIIKFSFDVFLW
jgi:hypothetical protein